MSEPRRRAEPRALAAYVLHAYDWSESSLILDLYTREEGRVVAVAKGAKRPYSQLRPVLLPFQRVSVQLGRAKGEDGQDEVRTLRAAEWAAGSAVLPSSALLGAYYLNELLMKFVPRGAAQPELFDHYHDTLQALSMAAGPLVEGPAHPADEAPASDASQQLQAGLRAFELLLLQDLGLLPDLTQDALGGGLLQAGERYTWQPELGLVRAGGQDEALSGQEWIHLQAALMGGHRAALRQACQAPRVALRTLLRRALAHHLGGAALRTRELMQSLRRFGVRTPTGATP
jgi:DNA repair protein RecO (recombination protein O)